MPHGFLTPVTSTPTQCQEPWNVEDWFSACPGLPFLPPGTTVPLP